MTEACRQVPPRVVEARSFSSAVLGFSILVMVCAAIGLFLFNPAQSGYYPLCLFHQSTGMLCPGCGSLRAMHQLLHGHVLAAMHYNALLVLSVPPGVWFGARFMAAKVKGKPFSFNVSTAALWSGLVVLL